MPGFRSDEGMVSQAGTRPDRGCVMLKEIYGTIKKLAFVAGFVLSLLAVVEVVRAYQIFCEVHPIVGYVA